MQEWLPLLRSAILAGICLLAFLPRLFSLARYEDGGPLIHEFDPQFNFRTTQYLTTTSFYDLHNWFDGTVWYPMGRAVGATVYPGLMVTAGAAHHVLTSLIGPFDVMLVCVYLSPTFAAFTSLVVYAMVADIHSYGAGLMASALMALVPGYIQRSVAGSYDNEAVAIFALLFTFYMWIRAVKSGSLAWASAAALAYFYMVSTWGAYVYVINMIALYVLVMILVGRFSHRLYIAYSATYLVGTMLSMNLQNILFIPVETSEHMAPLAAFVGLQAFVFVFYFVKPSLSTESFNAALRLLAIGVAVAGVALIIAASFSSGTSGRLLSLLDPLGKHMAITKSVSEHQPTVWTHFFMDLHILTVFMPIGAAVCFWAPTDGNVFILMYAASAVYFASVMVRLVLVLAPVACILSGIAISTLLHTYMVQPGQTGSAGSSGGSKGSRKKDAAGGPVPQVVSVTVISLIMFLLAFYVVHCTWVAQAAYSEPSVVLSTATPQGRVNFDDFREAYYWLRQNTAEDAVVGSWWDYGYQLATFSNRTTLVDNNTNNNTHIATMGKIMASNESVAYPLLKKHDVSYLLVVFGGQIGYGSDDIAKFLWMVRISGSVDSSIKEADYMSPSTGRYAVDDTASKTMKNSLMYKMCYYRFDSRYDRARGVQVNPRSIKLRYLEEAFTSEHWMVRIYRVVHPEGRLADPKGRATARRALKTTKAAAKKSPRAKVLAAKGSSRVLSSAEKGQLRKLDAAAARVARANPFLAMTPAQGTAADRAWRRRKRGDASETAPAKAAADRKAKAKDAKAAKTAAKELQKSSSRLGKSGNPVTPARMLARKLARQQR